MKIDCISDLHGEFPELPGGDLLIVAGDLTGNDTKKQYGIFFAWLCEQKYTKKIFIAGNHDNKLCPKDPYDGFLDFVYPDENSISYLCDSGTEFDGLKIWGSPWTRQFYGMNPDAMAFACETEDELTEKWALIPGDIDILITHSPPFKMFDSVNDRTFQRKFKHVGSLSLANRVIGNVCFPNLKLHVFGHIHECGGMVMDIGDRKFVNASIMNENYQPVNKPVRIEL